LSFYKVKELEKQVRSLQQAALERAGKQKETETTSFSLKHAEHKTSPVTKEREKLQLALEREVKQKEKETTSFSLKHEERKTSPLAKERKEVQEEIVENGLAAEVAQALETFQLSWDAQGSDKVTTGHFPCSILFS